MDNLCRSVIENQRKLYGAVIGQHLRRGMRYGLVGFPASGNVGDSAIWLGQLRILEELSGLIPSYVGTFRHPISEIDRCLGPGDPVFVSGGGNIGDLWQTSHNFREKLIEALPHRKIIQLPQSIHFKSQSNLDRCASVIAKHKNFHLYVRDEQSLRCAKENFDCTTILAPDAAFCLGSLKQISPRKKFDTIFLLRTDQEKSTADLSSLRSQGRDYGPVWDWIDEPANLIRNLKPKAIIQAILSGKYSRISMREILFRMHAKNRLKVGLGMLSSAEQVVTDRLHGHILCVLLNLPHVALDNSYGKVSSYIRTWTKDCSLVRVAENSHDVLRALLDVRSQKSIG